MHVSGGISAVMLDFKIITAAFFIPAFVDDSAVANGLHRCAARSRVINSVMRTDYLMHRMQSRLRESRADTSVVQRSLQKRLAQIVAVLVEILLLAVLLKAESVFSFAFVLEIRCYHIANAKRYGVACDIPLFEDDLARVAFLYAEKVDGPGVDVG